MSPRKTVAKKASKHPPHSSDSFKDEDANTIYTEYYKDVVIIVERGVDLVSLENTFIPKVFWERTWTKLLNPSGDVYDCIIKEFFANAFVEDHLNCWVQGKEFTISRESIQEILETSPMTPDSSLHYDEKRDKIESFVPILGGKIKKKSLHITEFSPQMRALAYI